MKRIPLAVMPMRGEVVDMGILIQKIEDLETADIRLETGRWQTLGIRHPDI